MRRRSSQTSRSTLHHLHAFMLGVAATASGLGAQQPRIANADPQLSSALDLYFSRAEAFGFSGAVLVSRRDSIILRKGYGFADRRSGRRVTPATMFGIASLDKQFIAAAILKLEELGKLRVTDALERHLGDVPADKRSITLQHLLTHTSGLPNLYWDEHPGPRTEFVRRVLSGPSVGAPGTTFRYSNANFWILEEVIARAAGRPYEEFMRAALFRPAGMTSTGLPPLIADTARVARYRYWSADPASRQPFDSTSILGRPPWWWMVISNVDDLFRWHRALGANRLLSDSSRRKLVTPFRQGYAMGWFVDRSERGTPVIHHSGSDSNLGGFLTDFREYPAEGIAVFILSNSMLGPGMTAATLGADIEHMIFGGPTTLPPPGSLGAASRSGFVGRYAVDGGGQFEIVAAPSGGLVLRGVDRRGRMGVRFPGIFVDTAMLPRDDVAAEAILHASKGDFGPLQRLADSTEYAQMEQLVKETVAPGGAGPLRGVRVLHQRMLTVDGELRRQSFVCLEFAPGCQMLRVSHRPSGRAIIDYVALPRFAEKRIARGSDGTLLTWDFTLASGLRLEAMDGAGGTPLTLRLTTAYGPVNATRILH